MISARVKEFVKNLSEIKISPQTALRTLILGALVFAVSYFAFASLASWLEKRSYEKDARKTDRSIETLDKNASQAVQNAANSETRADEAEKRLDRYREMNDSIVKEQQKLKRKADEKANNFNSNRDFSNRSGVSSAELDSLLRSAESTTSER